MDTFLEEQGVEYEIIDDEYFIVVNGISISEDAFFEVVLNLPDDDFIDKFIDEYIDTVIFDKIEEVFKPLPDYEKYYHISNLGNILSLRTNKILKQRMRSGYYGVSIFGSDNKMKVVLVHTLVAKTFLIRPKTKYKLVVDHVNSNKLDNRSNNLKYVTYSENTLNAHRNKCVKLNCKKVCQFGLDRKFIKRYDSLTHAEKETGILCQHISQCCLKKYKTAGGYIWRYSKLNKATENIIHDDEYFKSIPEIDGNKFSNYEISNYGKIRNVKTNKFMLQHVEHGYYKIQISTDSRKRKIFFVHRLVALTFCKKPKGYNSKYVVNHVDENKLNNHYTNLEWTTTKGNVTHSSGKAVEQIDMETGEVIRRFDSLCDAKRFMNLPVTNGDITRCCQGKRNYAYGYKWRFAEDVAEVTSDDLAIADNDDALYD